MDSNRYAVFVVIIIVVVIVFCAVTRSNISLSLCFVCLCMQNIGEYFSVVVFSIYLPLSFCCLSFAMLFLFHMQILSLIASLCAFVFVSLFCSILINTHYSTSNKCTCVLFSIFFSEIICCVCVCVWAVYMYNR